jgi:membrane protease YdiL (CAAX protease family)
VYEQREHESWDDEDEDDPPPRPEPSREEHRRARLRAAAQLTIALGGFVAVRVGLELAGVFERISARAPTWEIPAHVFMQGGAALLLALLCLRAFGEGASTIGAGRLARPWLEVGRGFGLVVGIYVVMVPLMLAAMMLIRGPARAQMVLQKTQVMQMVVQIPLAALLPSALMAGLYEELFVRGLIQSRVAKVMAGAAELRWTHRYGAVALSAALFGLGHIYQGPVGVMQTTVVGVILGVAAAHWRSIWAAVVAHVVIDTMGLLVSRVLLPATQGLLQRS